MALTVTVTRKLGENKTILLFGTIVASGSYATNGDALDFGPLVGWTNKQPLNVDVRGKAGFIYQYDYVNKKLLVYVNTAGGANAPLGEHTAATYAAGVSGDTITFLVTFAKG